MWLCQITALAASATATFALPSAAPCCEAKETDGRDYSEKASITVALPALIEKISDLLVRPGYSYFWNVTAS